jgi:hypothetical protein
VNPSKKVVLTGGEDLELRSGLGAGDALLPKEALELEKIWFPKMSLFAVGRSFMKRTRVSYIVTKQRRDGACLISSLRILSLSSTVRS